MKLFIKLFFLSLCVLSGVLTVSCLEATETERQELMKDEIESLRRTFSLFYAPADYKKERFGWDVNEVSQRIKDEIDTHAYTSTLDFQKHVLKMLRGTNDYHVSVNFFSTSVSVLPVALRYAQERFYLVELDEFLKENSEDDEETESDETPSFSFLELLAVDGIEVESYFNAFVKDELGVEFNPHTRNKALMTFPFRIGFHHLNVPKTGVLTRFTVKNVSGEVLELEKRWEEVSKERVLPRNLPTSKQTEKSDRWNIVKERAQFVLPEYSMRNEIYKAVSQKYPRFMRNLTKVDPSMDTRVSTVNHGRFGPFGRVVWETDHDWNFYAYIFQTETGRNIGYIHVPTYLPEDPETNAKHFQELMGFMNSRTEALIFDQLDNRGGSLFYLYGLIACMTDRPLMTLKQEEKLVHQQLLHMEDFVLELEELVESARVMGLSLEELLNEEGGSTLSGYRIDESLCRSFASYVNFLKQEWIAGKSTTARFPIMGIELITPHPTTRYTQPILMLINENDGSCGDFMPVIMQENKRATLFGQTTAGAGGYIKAVPHQTWFGVATITLTGSLAYRADGAIIENNGVQPDIFYTETENDLKNNYCDYQTAVLQEVEKLLDER